MHPASLSSAFSRVAQVQVFGVAKGLGYVFAFMDPVAIVIPGLEAPVMVMIPTPVGLVTLLSFSMLLNVALLLGWFRYWKLERKRSLSSHGNVRSSASKSGDDCSGRDSKNSDDDVGDGSTDLGCSRAECDATFKEVSRQYKAKHGRRPSPCPLYHVKESKSRLHVRRSCAHIKGREDVVMREVCKDCFSLG